MKNLMFNLLEYSSNIDLTALGIFMARTVELVNPLYWKQTSISIELTERKMC